MLSWVQEHRWDGAAALRLQGLSFLSLLLLINEDTVSFVEGIECTLIFESIG